MTMRKYHTRSSVPNSAPPAIDSCVILPDPDSVICGTTFGKFPWVSSVSNNKSSHQSKGQNKSTSNNPWKTSNVVKLSVNELQAGKLKLNVFIH